MKVGLVGLAFLVGTLALLPPAMAGAGNLPASHSETVSLMEPPGAGLSQPGDGPFGRFAGPWGRHGFGLTVSSDGTASVSWRIYQWCGPGVPEPCDRLEGNLIISGGRGSIRFTAADEVTAYGEVLETTDPQALPPGPVMVTLLPYGMAWLWPSPGVPLLLCGPRFAEEAPRRIMDQFPCGA